MLGRNPYIFRGAEEEEKGSLSVGRMFDGGAYVDTAGLERVQLRQTSLRTVDWTV